MYETESMICVSNLFALIKQENLLETHATKSSQMYVLDADMGLLRH